MRSVCNFDHNWYKQKDVSIDVGSSLKNIQGYFEQVGESQWQVVSIFWKVSGMYLN